MSLRKWWIVPFVVLVLITLSCSTETNDDYRLLNPPTPADTTNTAS